MNKSTETRETGAPPQCGRIPVPLASPTTSAREPGPRLIQVLPFADGRRSTPGLLSRRSEQQTLGSQPCDSSGILTVDRHLITDRFVKALQRAGHDVLLAPEPTGPAGSTGTTPSAVLEGRIWSFHFRTRPAPVLEVDVSLVLTDARQSAVLWQVDFPPDDSLPFWIGLGCPSEHLLSAALHDVETAAFEQFGSEAFCQAVGTQPKPVQRPASEESHDIVLANSWTATDAGEITATARESGQPTSAPPPAGETSSSPHPIRPLDKKSRWLTAVKAD
ncbi:MAG: hypothetical protein MUE94_10690 [Verrucomicrobia bacterium]|nr:hypothetical protein [Verrucomicrobiota bacterium]